MTRLQILNLGKPIYLSIDKDNWEMKLLTEWKCSDCGYSMSGDAPPEVCPSCLHKCEFIDVTCYIPECKEEGRDYRL